MAEISVEFGRFVKAARARAGLSAAELGERINRSVAGIYTIERGEIPPVSVLAALADALNLSVWDGRYFYGLAGRIPPG